MADLEILTPVDALAEGCPVVTKTRSVIMSRGQTANIAWEIRDRDGNPLDLSGYLCDGVSESSEGPECGSVNVRFQDVFGTSNILQVNAVTDDAAAGTIHFEVPPAIAKQVGIYRMDIGVLNHADELVFTNTGLLSVERSLFALPTNDCDTDGPITLNEIRMFLRDTMLENNLLDAVEFDDSEILQAIILPIREWNETPPPVAVFTPMNFPFRYNWLVATAARLLRTAAFSYLRNDLQSAHGGLQIADKAKAQPYLALAEPMTQEWKQFILAKKVQINATLAFGTVNSWYMRSF